jgi:hypothetical protein
LICNSVVAFNGDTNVSFTSNNAALSVIGIMNSIIYGSTAGYGIRNATSGVCPSCTIRNCAVGSNSLGDLSNVPTGEGTITLSSNPFIGDDTGDYSLNSSVDGGALCKEAGFSVADIL